MDLGEALKKQSPQTVVVDRFVLEPSEWNLKFQRKLESKDFLRLVEDSSDRRLRSILPTEGFLKKYDEFSVAVLKHSKP